ncbi:MAG: hypothetical protein MH204_04395, partial [Fimbriimonadaceae bacterium]|nr:hypothetical protein [Fimbriimonadaceae bacterium]
ARVDDPERLAGVRLVVGLSGTELGEGTARALTDGRISGILLMRPNLVSPEQTRRLTDAIRAAAAEGGRPMPIICIDVEGGPVNRVARLPGAPDLPAGEEAAGLEPGALEAKAAEMGRYLRELGINVVLAPVVDLARPDSRVLAGRAYSSDPEEVGRIAAEFVRGMESAGLATVLKHFPGHGLTALDTHTSVASAEGGPEELKRHSEPFFSVGRLQRQPAVMMSHLIVPDWGCVTAAGGCRAAVSAARNRTDRPLLVWSDGMGMTGAGDAGPAELLAGLLEAGTDIFLTTQPLEGLPEGFAVEAMKEIADEPLQQAHRHIMVFRRSLSGPGGTGGGAAPEEPEPARPR